MTIKFVVFFSIIEFETRKLNKIWIDLMLILKLRVISFLIFFVIAIFLWIKWKSINVALWKCANSTIFKIQMSMSFSRVIVQIKKYFMRLLLICLRWRFKKSFDFFFRSQNNQIFRVFFNLFFLMRPKTTIYFWTTACSLILLIKFFKFL